jgi:hypothetical protein
VNHRDVYAYLLKQRHFLSERVELLLVFGDFARELDHKGLVFESLDVGQRFPE